MKKYNWLEAFKMMMEAPGECFMRFGGGCVYKISSNRLYVWIDKHWLESSENVANFNKCMWTKVPDPSEKWVRCTHKELWKWILAKWAKGVYSAKFRSVNPDGSVRVPWSVEEIQWMDPTMWIINGEFQHEYLDQ
jgi:hypothetical protein